MSSDGTVQALEVTDSGFTIAKEISRKGGEHIQVDLEITSTHDKQATVDLVESVPPGTDQSQVGFMTGNEPSEWDLTEDGHLRLQARLVAQGSRQIVYGIRDIENMDLESLAEETHVINVGGPAGGDIEVNPDLEPSPTDATADEAVEEEATVDTDTVPADADTSPARVDGDAAAAETDDAGGGDGLAGTLDDETAEELATRLAPHLEDEMELDAITETKIAQLQEDVADMRGYLPAFEDFLGETGRADDILDELDELRAAVDELDDAPEDLENTIESMDGRLADIEETTAEFDDKLDEILARLEELESWREDIAAASQ